MIWLYLALFFIVGYVAGGASMYSIMMRDL
jgi:hypothetical protein